MSQAGLTMFFICMIFPGVVGAMSGHLTVRDWVIAAWALCLVASIIMMLVGAFQ